MPIDISKNPSQEYYKYPFDKLINILTQIGINNEQYVNYIEKWIRILTDADSIAQEERKKYIAYTTSYIAEAFQYTCFFRGINIPLCINFDIEYLKNFVVVNNFPIEIYDLNKFTEEIEIKSSRIDLKNIQNIQKTPVLLYPPLNPTHTHILIDGNTRYTYAQKNNLKYIETIKIIDPKPNDFITSLDWLAYCFRIDLFNTIKFVTENTIEFNPWKSKVNFVSTIKQNKY